MRYYTADAAYRRKGPPPPALRMLAPLLVGDTLLVYASGVAQLLIGPSSRQPLLLIHKASFILWLALTAATCSGTCRSCWRCCAPGIPRARRSKRCAPRAPRAGWGRSKDPTAPSTSPGRPDDGCR